MKLITSLSLFALSAATVAICFAAAKDAAPIVSQTTQERMYGRGWWPTGGDAEAKDYAGEAACASCHGDIAALQNTTPMYHAGTPASRSKILAEHPSLEFKEGPYTSTLEKGAAGVTYSVSDGVSSDSKSVAWAFGNGELGQTYLLKNNNGYIEARLSFYSTPQALDITTGHSDHVPGTLQEAFGHTLSLDTAQRCFSCHTTAAVTSGEFAPEKSVPGITCEACHGPGAKHIAAVGAGRDRQAVAAITNPASLSPSDSVDFCGACHRTLSDVAVFMPANLGILTVRFQPYRLEKSRCWGKNGDARVTCIACHDPHKPLVRDMVAYDAKCLACHRSSIGSHPGATALACKVSTGNCASCHMPKVELPQTHALFTDHDIRVVRSSVPSPDKPGQPIILPDQKSLR